MSKPPVKLKFRTTQNERALLRRCDSLEREIAKLRLRLPDRTERAAIKRAPKLEAIIESLRLVQATLAKMGENNAAFAFAASKMRKALEGVS